VARRLLLLALLVLPLVGCDQATKALARTYLTPGVGVEYLGGAVTFTLEKNPGAFLSYGSGLPGAARRGLFVFGVALALTALAVFLVTKVSLMPGSVALGALILAGGLGNLVDRLLFHGAVTDFLLLRAGPLHTGVLNLADVLITVAPLALFLRELLPRRTAGPPTPPPPSP
jgi:signal peptidase II